MIQFPQDFLWGAATSAYQVEGNNVYSDWWEWERSGNSRDICGEACRHYQLYPDDFRLAKSLNHNAHRFSIEWSRIEPQEGNFSQEALQHYRQVALCLKGLNIEPIVTLHHFTNPLWFSQMGGWKNKRVGQYFLRYVEKVVNSLSETVRFWVTINEPMIYVYHGYIIGIWPPEEKSFLSASKVMRNLSEMHIEAYRLIHNIYQRKKLSPPAVSLAHNMLAFMACSRTLKNRTALFLRDHFFNFLLLDKLSRHKSLDFIGVNYYTRNLIDVEIWKPKSLILDVCQHNHHPLSKNSLGWDIYPKGLYQLLLRLKKYRLPVFILENGISTEDDSARWDFIWQHLKNLHLAMQEGLSVLGYLYWSLIDNFEWEKGFRPRFGLIHIDYHSYQRTVMESAKRFSVVCASGRID